MLTIDVETARRFILGKQGLWPGRRWRGLRGTERALRSMEYLQLDPLQIVARSQDIALQSRVLDYVPGMWEELAYRKRKFFDWGGWLALRPMDELPFWRVVMHRERDGRQGDSRIRRMAHDHANAIIEMRAILRERGTLINREFEMATRTRTEGYRGRKDSALALYYLWRTGEVMTHHRNRFERIYGLTESVAPADRISESEEEEADRFLVRKEVAFGGLSRIGRTADAYHGRGEPDRAAKKVLGAMLAEGEIIEVLVDGWRQVHYALGSDAKLLHDLSAGRVPKAWTPLDTTTVEEVAFLAPLDPVAARGRAKLLFGFDYVWEVYKPEHQRKFGYYALPILWGDRLVARFDSRLDRTSNTFVILGLWLEERSLAKDEVFAEALARGFARFFRFLGASKMDVKAIASPLLRRRLTEVKRP
ncbi:MAG: winged helix-turn-helix domain-containing protein [Anaerolineae bacterium]